MINLKRLKRGLINDAMKRIDDSNYGNQKTLRLKYYVIIKINKLTEKDLKYLMTRRYTGHKSKNNSKFNFYKITKHDRDLFKKMF